MAKVLVVDDSLSVRKVVEKALEGRGVHVLSAATAAEAIEHIEREHPDIVVCDVVLPDRDGYQICEFVRSHPAVGRVPVLLISGVVNSTVLSRAAEVQSNDVMFKPFAADELVRKIDTLLGSAGGNGGSPAPAPAVARSVPPSVDLAAAAERAANMAAGRPGNPTRADSPARPESPARAEAAARPEPLPGQDPAALRLEGPARGESPSRPEGPARVDIPARGDFPPRDATPSRVQAPPARPSAERASTSGARDELRETPSRLDPAMVPDLDGAAEGLKGRLAWLIATSGARFAALADREGFLIEFAGDVPLEVEVAGALASCLAESSDGIGRELHQGTLLGMILEYEKGMLLLHAVGSSALLAVVLGETAALGKARYYIKKVLPELQRAL